MVTDRVCVRSYYCLYVHNAAVDSRGVFEAAIHHWLLSSAIHRLTPFGLMRRVPGTDQCYSEETASHACEQCYSERNLRMHPRARKATCLVVTRAPRLRFDKSRRPRGRLPTEQYRWWTKRCHAIVLTFSRDITLAWTASWTWIDAQIWRNLGRRRTTMTMAFSGDIDSVSVSGCPVNAFFFFFFRFSEKISVIGHRVTDPYPLVCPFCINHARHWICS